MVELYVKVAAQNFDATVLDSDDLSTIRGSSLALLRFPKLLLDHLDAQIDAELSIEPLQASASETVLRIAGRGRPQPAERYEPTRPAKGMNKNGRKRALLKTAEGLGPSAAAGAIRSAAEKLCQGFGQLEDLSRIEVVIQQLEDACAMVPQAPAAAIDFASLRPEIEKACRCLAGQRIDGWAFDCFTFAVASHLVSKRQTLQTIFTLLDNQLRHQQQKSLTVPLPLRGPSPLPPASKAVCRVTGVLAAVTDKPEPRSESVRLRRKSGVEQRHDFYKEQLAFAADRAKQLLDDPLATIFRDNAVQAVRQAAADLPELADKLTFESFGFAKSFEDIVADPPDHLPPGARNKLAVVHIDGNSFGRQARERAEKGDRAIYRRYSLYLEAQGGLLLKAILDWMLSRPTMRVRGKSEESEPYRLRFETLLWGGDEMTFVLPAWEAADFMTMLQAALSTWPIPEYDKAEGQLTFAAGMVFGNVKTPIRDLRRVAYDLCNAVKREKDQRPGNWLQAISLEGVDRAEINPAAVRRVLLKAEDKHVPHFDIDGARWGELGGAGGNGKKAGHHSRPDPAPSPIPQGGNSGVDQGAKRP